MKRRIQIWQRGTSKILAEFTIDAEENELSNLNDISQHFFTEIPLTATDLDEVKAREKSRINYIAGKIRERYMSNGAGIDSIYMLKKEEAEHYLSVGGGDYPMLSAEAQATGQSVAKAAAYIAAVALAWKSKAAEIEIARRTGELSIKTADNQNDVIMAADSAVTDLYKIE